MKFLVLALCMPRNQTISICCAREILLYAPQHYYLNEKKFQNDFIVTVECLNDNITSVDAF